MKKTYIQPEIEVSLAALKFSILGVSGSVDGNPEISDGGEDTGGLSGDVNMHSLWDEE